METKMRYVQQRVENFILRTMNGSVAEQWRDPDDTTDQAACVIVNLSLGGAAMLLPKQPALPANVLRLHIPVPGDTAVDDLSITASVRWTDPCYSIKRMKIGLEFMEYGDDDKTRLRKLIEWFTVCENTALPCSLALNGR